MSELDNAARALLEVIHRAELTARLLERERNEGDADAVRRSTFSALLGLGPGDALEVGFEDVWTRLQTGEKWWERRAREAENS